MWPQHQRRQSQDPYSLRMPSKPSGSNWRGRLYDSSSDYSDSEEKDATCARPPATPRPTTCLKSTTRPNHVHRSASAERVTKKPRTMDASSSRNTTNPSSCSPVHSSSRPSVRSLRSRYLERRAVNVGNGLRMPPKYLDARPNCEQTRTFLPRSTYVRGFRGYSEVEDSDSGIDDCESDPDYHPNDNNETTNSETLPDMNTKPDDTRKEVRSVVSNHSSVPLSQWKAKKKSASKTTMINSDIASHGMASRRGVFKTITKDGARKGSSVSQPSRMERNRTLQVGNIRASTQIRNTRESMRITKNQDQCSTQLASNRVHERDTSKTGKMRGGELSEWSEILEAFDPQKTSSITSPTRSSGRDDEEKEDEITVVKDMKNESKGKDIWKSVGTENSDQIEVISLLSPLRNHRDGEDDDDDDDEIEIVSHVCTNTTKRRSRKAATPVAEAASHAVAGGEAVVVSEKRGVRALRDLAHARPHCEVHPFGVSSKLNEKVCSNCYCTKCQKKAIVCEQWKEHASLELTLPILIS